jgi:hypothetical protein
MRAGRENGERISREVQARAAWVHSYELNPQQEKRDHDRMRQCPASEIPMYSFHRFVTFLCFAGMIVGCEKRGRQELSKVMDKKPPLITTLPINDEVFSFNVGNGTVRYSPPDGTAEFFNKVQEVGSSFSKTNRMDLEYPYGHFLISENLQVIGLSLLPRLTYHDVMPLGLVGWPTDSMAGLPDEWLCVDGGLLSIQEMQQYNDLARRFRHHTPKGFKREVAHRDVEVVFFGIGFAGYARSIKEYEHHTMDRFWRKSRE